VLFVCSVFFREYLFRVAEMSFGFIFFDYFSNKMLSSWYIIILIIHNSYLKRNEICTTQHFNNTSDFHKIEFHYFSKINLIIHSKVVSIFYFYIIHVRRRIKVHHMFFCIHFENQYLQLQFTLCLSLSSKSIIVKKSLQWTVIRI